MSTLPTANKNDNGSSEDRCQLPQQLRILPVADIPKASTEALHLLKSIGK